MYITEMIFFSVIFLWKLFSESCWTRSEQVKNDHFIGGVDGFSYFSLISVILFSNQDHPWYYVYSYNLWQIKHP